MLMHVGVCISIEEYLSGRVWYVYVCQTKGITWIKEVYAICVKTLWRLSGTLTIAVFNFVKCIKRFCAAFEQKHKVDNDIRFYDICLFFSLQMAFQSFNVRFVEQLGCIFLHGQHFAFVLHISGQVIAMTLFLKN